MTDQTSMFRDLDPVFQDVPPEQLEAVKAAIVIAGARYLIMLIERSRNPFDDIFAKPVLQSAIARIQRQGLNALF